MNECIFHIALADDWEGAQRFGEYEGSTRAKTLDQVGFVHAATAGDLENVLATVYGDLRLPLVVVVVDQDALLAAGVSIRWDERNPSPPGADTRVPRILGAIPLDPDIVLDVLPIDEVGGEWVVPDMSAYTLRDTTR
ncbi:MULTISPECIES: DUF952 domain-containing protein [Rhodococcus]|jgi:uncharacterized protein (DUF952 family)|uniref:DUF952 domain-containing protein n=1 Tax=Rhodococcus TaxID=1827 RepID=UPI0002B7D837|nr:MULTISPECIES: DUF952 domain-containing protein [Rhodococcus]MCW0193087.1 DUF952 domain-containing protein [Rhodococcus sp. (in: high G+C Gram-positive bacteria)]EME18255.1 hypothetical protein G418_20189 [Rhodococcus qingshengii BKS 20-40]MBW0292698.1 glutathione transferase [Rhodococcus sp. MH15]MDI9960765.1 DUF952 domain-containing protein [Rhodococcus sp. IEGM 1237]MDV8129248.1 DUF952 domain-containing protein [Rhodococcus sp. IEGM 1304]